MNTYWQRLGIAPTDDRRAIKRAYAARLKHTRPDDDAEAYQRLREAYDWALANVQRQGAQPAEDAVARALSPEPAAPARRLDLMHADRLGRLAPAQCRVLGVNAGQARDGQRAEVDPRPLAHARWWRYRVPEHAARYAAPVDRVDAVTEPPLDPDAVMAALEAVRDRFGPTGLDAHVDTLTEQLDALPLWAQDRLQRALVHFILDDERLSPRFVLALAERFGWGTDFRLEPRLGEANALRLYARLKTARGTPLAPDATVPAEPPEQRYRHLLHTARCHDTGRMGRFWVRLLLSPLALFDALRQPDARDLLDAEGLDWRVVGRWSWRVFLVQLAGLAVGLSLLQGAQSLLSALPRPVLPLAMFGAGALGYQLLRCAPGPLIDAWYARPHHSALARWIVRQRHGWKLPWMAFFLSWALVVAAVGWSRELAAAGFDSPHDYALGAAMLLLPIALLLILVWPAGETWSPLFVPIGLAGSVVLVVLFDGPRDFALGAAVLVPPIAFLLLLVWPAAESWSRLIVPTGLGASAVLAGLFDGPYAALTGLLAGFAWVVSAVVFVRRAPALSARFINAPFSLLLPKNGWGWLAFVVFFKGVFVFYAAVFALGAPVFLLAYARQAGPVRAYLALCSAAALYGSGGLAMDSWAAVLWLQIVLFVLVRVGRVSDWFLSRPALRAA